MQTEPGVFTKTYCFDDISFKTRSDEEQDEIYTAWQKFLNTIGDREDIFISFVNESEDNKVTLGRVLPTMMGDKYDNYRREMSEMLSVKMQTSRNNIITKK